MKTENVGLKSGKEKIFNDLEKALNSQAVKHSWELDLSLFPESAPMEEIVNHDYFKEVFSTLNEVKTQPCLYQFDVLSPEPTESFTETLFEIKKHLDLQGIKMAPINKGVVSNCLYIGIRQPGYFQKKGFSKISSRLLAHFGYYDKGAGVKLNNWNQLRKLKFKLSVFVFEESCAPFLELIEKVYSMHEKPMIGRH